MIEMSLTMIMGKKTTLLYQLVYGLVFYVLMILTAILILGWIDEKQSFEWIGNKLYRNKSTKARLFQNEDDLFQNFKGLGKLV